MGVSVEAFSPKLQKMWHWRAVFVLLVELAFSALMVATAVKLNTEAVAMNSLIS